jgi:P4 family phage/plasmid primase-like protien
MSPAEVVPLNVTEGDSGAVWRAELASGFGKHHSPEGKNPRPLVTVTYAAIRESLPSPVNVSKGEAPWLLASTYTASRRKAAQLEHGTYHGLWCDLDTPKGLTFEQQCQLIQNAVGQSVRCLAYTSKSATSDEQKMRALLPLARPVSPTEYMLLQRALNDRLEVAGLTPDRAAEKPVQVCYLPNRGEFYAWDEWGTTLLDPSTWEAELGVLRRTKDAEDEAAALRHELAKKAREERERRPIRATDYLSPIDAFNSKHRGAEALLDLMASYGYEIHGDRALSPLSESGEPAVRILEDGVHWYSDHGSDAGADIGHAVEAGGRRGDAFDLYKYREHENDEKAAMDAIAAELVTSEGITLAQHNQRALENRAREKAKAESLRLEQLVHGTDSARDLVTTVADEVTRSDVNRAEKLRLRKLIAKRADTSVRALEQDAAAQEEARTHLDYARAALSQLGEGDLVHASKTFWRYGGTGVWSEADPEEVRQAIHKVVPRHELTGNAVDSILKLARTECYDPGAQFGEPHNSINVANGLLVHDGSGWVLEPHRKDLYLLAQLPVEYDPQATAPRFQRFLSEIFEGDADAQDKKLLLLQLMGYSLLPSARFEKFVLLVGNGANGKSVLLEVLAALLGADNVASVSPDNLDSRFQRGYLLGKLVNVVTEIAEGAIINDAALKALTSGELTTAERKFRDPFTFRPYATCWFATNHLPHTRDFSDALFRRACLLTFNQTFTGDRCDPRLKDKLLEELPGILNLALEAFGAVLQGAPFAEPASMLEARRDWRTEADQARQYIEECCVLDPDAEVPKGELYEDYRGWTRRAGINTTLKHRSFSNRLQRAGVGSRKDGKQHYYTGIRLASPSGGWPE